MKFVKNQLRQALLLQIWRCLGINETYQKYLFVPFPQTSVMNVSVDANLDPDDTFGSPQFCSINCSAGLRFAQYCILNCRQPDKYGRKGNFKNQRNESVPFKNLSKEEPLRLLQVDPHQWSSGRKISWLTVLSEMTTHWWCSADIFWVCRQALWWIALPKL